MAQEKLGAQENWGLKRTCLGCGARFYDLNNSPIICPKCDVTFDVEAASKLKRSRNMAVEVKKAPPKDDILNITDSNEDSAANTNDDDLLDDTSDLNSGDNIIAVNNADGNDEE